MQRRRHIAWLAGGALFMFLSTQTGRLYAQGGNCGPFTDVPATSVYCPFILQAFISSITQGTSPTTFSPSDLVPREQMVTFFTRTMDLTLHRGTDRTAIGKTWAPSSANGAAVSDVGGAVNDIVTDGTYLWIARSDGKILKVNIADRRGLEIWSLASGAGVPRKLGVFAGLVWIADDQGALHVLNPAAAAGAATQLINNVGIIGNLPTLGFDGTNVWWASAGASVIAIYPVGTQGYTALTAPASVDGMVFDGTYMWVLLANSTLWKLNLPTAPGQPPTVAEALTIPGPVKDCRMVFDGNNIWIPIGTNGTLYVIRPTTNSSPSAIASQTIPDVLSPYVASFDGESVMIGGINNGIVALYKATNLVRIRTFATGATGVRGIASDGKTFNIGDASGTKFFQY